MNLITTRNASILIIILLSAWWSARALLDYNTNGSKAPLRLIPDNVNLTLKNIKKTKIRAGETLWTLVAESATQYQEDGITQLSNVQLFFFDEKARKTEITSDHGSLMSQYQKMIFSSNVVMTNSSGNTLQTDYLEYDEISDIFQTDILVKINFYDLIVRGIGMEIDVENQILTLLNDVNVTGTMNIQ
jgi:LPS export ABC transporter protein LptC